MDLYPSRRTLVLSVRILSPKNVSTRIWDLQIINELQCTMPTKRIWLIPKMAKSTGTLIIVRDAERVILHELGSTAEACWIVFVIRVLS